MLLNLNRMGPGRYVLYAIGVLTALFLLLPVVFIAALSFGSSQWLQFPPPGWTLKWYAAIFNDPRWMDSIWTSVKVAFTVMVLSIVLGLPAAFALVRGKFPGRTVLHAFFISPMIVPVIILAIALYAFVLKFGLNGTFIAFVAAHLIIALPFSVICIVNSLEGFDESTEKAAIVCGATKAEAIFRVTLPAIRLGIFSAALFSFLASWDEVVLGIFMASPILQTLPVKMWTTLRQDLTPVIASVSTLLIALTIVIMIITAFLRRRYAR
ncbi:ABC transporter permease [Dongia soli]|uniref:ABC transporter permease n=1 Tax=Dongia soli TaxID=600628 RepID=A0ABU5EI11_9PROT|nr:ABC transporter permease [Dongia soli]MDY0885502.1 ABC transporter permease [Dongia soli]